MMIKPMTYGQLWDLLTELGFNRWEYDAHNLIYRHGPEKWLFFLPNRPPETMAREGDVSLIRRQLDAIRLMEMADFDAHFNGLTTAANA